MKYLLVLLSILLLSCRPVTVMEIADLTTEYPTIDMGLGIGYNWFVIRNQGYARLGTFVSADLNSDLSPPGYGGIGLFIGREIQRNVTIGGIMGYRFGEFEGIQFGMYLGIDIIPWLSSGK